MNMLHLAMFAGIGWPELLAVIFIAVCFFLLVYILLAILVWILRKNNAIARNARERDDQK